tara:strand:- start:1270 stop:1542 length:273 start_codon:yes stop_codon:yes gene_type:complete
MKLDKKRYKELCDEVFKSTDTFRQITPSDQVLMLCAMATQLGSLTGEFGHPLDKVLEIVNDNYDRMIRDKKTQLEQEIAMRSKSKSKEMH